MVLGGEGGTIPNVARCWWSLSHLFCNLDYVFSNKYCLLSFCWVVADSGCTVGEELDNNLPFNQYNEYVSPHGEFKHKKILRK